MSSASLNATKIEQLAIIYFLVHENMEPRDIHKHLKNVNRESVMSVLVGKWMREFCDGRTNIFDRNEWEG